MSDLLKNLRARLGLAEDADEAAIEAALEAALPGEGEDGEGEGDDDGTADSGTGTPTTTTVAPAAVAASGVVAIDAATLADLRAKAERGDAAARRQEAQEREDLVAAAIEDGRIPPARRAHWLTSLDVDPEGSREQLASLAPGLIPVSPLGHGQDSGQQSAAAEIRKSPAYTNWSM